MEEDGKEGGKNYEHKLLQSCLVELPTSSIYYTSACSQLSTHSLKKTVNSCETNIDSITYSDTHNINWKSWTHKAVSPNMSRKPTLWPGNFIAL